MSAAGGVAWRRTGLARPLTRYADDDLRPLSDVGKVSLWDVFNQIRSRQRLRGERMRWALLIALSVGLVGTQGHAESRDPPSLTGHDLAGAPWGIAAEMPCAKARENLVRNGMEPFSFPTNAKRVGPTHAKANDPHPIDVGPGDFKSSPNVIQCATRAAEWCDYAYRRKRDGRMFVLQTMDSNGSDCVVNRIFFAATARKSTQGQLEPRDIYGDWMHNIDLPVSTVR